MFWEASAALIFRGLGGLSLALFGGERRRPGRACCPCGGLGWSWQEIMSVCLCCYGGGTRCPSVHLSCAHERFGVLERMEGRVRT